MQALTDAALNASSPQDKLAFLIQAKQVSATMHFACAHNQIEHFVIRFVDELCRLPPPQALPLAQLAVPVEALALLLTLAPPPSSSSSPSLPTTMRWAVAVAGRIWKPMLFCLASQGTTATAAAPAASPFKHHLWAIKQAILKSQLDLYSIRFLECAALSLLRSDPDQDLLQQQLANRRRHKQPNQQQEQQQQQAAPQFESLKDCPHAHALLNAVELSREGMQCVDRLVAELATTLGSTNSHRSLTQTINSLTLIGRFRPDARERIVQALGQVAASGAAEDDALAQLLKPNLFLLLKAAVPNETAFGEAELTATATGSGTSYSLKQDIVRQLKTNCHLGEEHVVRYLGPLEKKWAAAQLKREELKRRLEAYPENRHNLFPTEGLPMLPLETLAKFLMDNVHALPEPPPGHRAKPDQAKVALAQSLLPVQLDKLLQQIKAVESGRAGLLVNLPQPIKDCAAIHVSGEQALKLREGAFARVLSAAAMAVGTGQFDAPVAVAKLACDVTEDGQSALKQLLHREIKNSNTNANTNTKSGAGGDAEEAGLLTALHLEFAADSKHRYPDFALAIVSALASTKQTSRLVRLVGELPALSPALMDVLLQGCEDPAQFLDYFAILRSLVLSRPSAREQCVWYLLKQHAVRKSALVGGTGPDSRSAAVNLVAGQLVNGLGAKWKKRICDFAQSTVRSMRPEDSEVHDEEGVVSRILLLVALCAVEPYGLLPAFFHSYAELKLRYGAEHEELANLVFTTIDRECDKLWQKLAQEIPATNALQTFLQHTPLASADLVFRAVEVFCAKSPTQQTMLAVLTLMQQEGAAAGGEEQQEAEDDPVVARDARFLVPIVGLLSRDEILLALGRICTECDKLLVERAVHNVVLERTVDSCELFVSLTRNEIGTESPEGLAAACDALLDKLDESTVRQCVVELLNMLDSGEEEEEAPPPPSLLLRNARKALQLFPGTMRPLVLQLVHRAVQREIWTLGDEFLWDGFQQLCLACIPDTFEIMLSALPDEVFLDFVQANEGRVKHFKEMLKRAALSLLQDNTKSGGGGGAAAPFQPGEVVKLYLGI